MADEELNVSEAAVAILSQRDPQHVAAARAAEPGRLHYMQSEQDGMREVVPDEIFDDSTAPTQQRHAAIRNLRSMLVDVGLGGPEGRQLLNKTGVLKDVPVEDQMRDARKHLRRVFGGDDEVDRALADVRSLATRDPRLGKFLMLRGLTNDGETLALLAQKARSQRLAGKLK